MDAFSINMTARKNLGFFLTSGTKTKENENEYTILERGVKVARDKLREHKIRGATILKNLALLHSITEDVSKELIKAGKEEFLEEEADGWKAYASMIVMASLSRYNDLMEFQKKNTKKD